jgi:hypothetical protein
VTIAIDDPSGRRVRTFASDDAPEPIAADIVVPTYWVRPTRIPSALPGTHRFVWDLRETPPAAFAHDYPISAIVHDTPRTPEGVLVQPGTYVVTVTADGRRSRQTLRVVMDPRVTTSAAALHDQYALAEKIADEMNRTFARASQAKDAASAARLRTANGELARYLDLVEGADAEPTVNLHSTVGSLIEGIDRGGHLPQPQGEDEP